jgi:putative effector of murein hydrolase
MREFLSESAFFCIALTVLAYLIGTVCQKKWKSAIYNPILIGTFLVILVLWALDIPVEKYQEACRPLYYWMTPATICLVVVCYKQLQKLKDHMVAIIFGVVGGVLASLLSVGLMCRLFGFDAAMIASLMPKSVTTAIGVVLSEQAGGIGALTTAAIVITGVFGNVAGPFLSKIFRLKDPVSQGVAYGTASHIAGTSRATEISDLCGAASSLSLTLAGLLTAVLLSFFYM